MRFTTARLCGGKALMAISADILDIDMDRAAGIMEAEGCRIKERDEMMLVFDWNGMETTLYSQGKVMFLPQTDRAKCISDATEILEKVRRGRCASGSDGYSQCPVIYDDDYPRAWTRSRLWL